MGIKIAVFSALFLISFANFASAQNSDPVIQYGKTTQFNFKSSADGVLRINLLYVPQSIQGVTGKFKTTVFLHGGGTEYTADDAGAVKIALEYLSDFTDYAEKNKVILLFPTSALGWGRQTSYFFRQFIPFVEAKLPIDDDYLVLAGHSMGGMGITREYPYVTDLFSGVLGMSAGIQEAMINKNAILPYFNGTPYIELNGKNDEDFPGFLAQEQKFNTELATLSTQLGLPSKYRLDLFEGGHDYDLPSAMKELDELFTQKKIRDPKYMTIRLGVVHSPAAPGSPGMLPIPKIDGSLDHQYWLGVSDYQDSGKTAYIYLHAQIVKQTIFITTDGNDLQPTTLNLTVDQNLLNLHRRFRVRVNGRVVFRGKAPKPIAPPQPVQAQGNDMQAVAAEPVPYSIAIRL
jgi:hypothetical protein